MELKDKFIVGQKYNYSQIPQEDTDQYTVSEYGLEYLGQNAIHIRVFKGEIDIWFIYCEQWNEGVFLCVYNN